MSWYNYAKSFWNTTEVSQTYRWVSVLILFNDGNKIVLDKGYVFLGDIPLNHICNYINFTNFNLIGGHIFYMSKNGTTKYIDPNKIHLHFKFGQSPFSWSEDNRAHWNLFFSSIDSKIYKSIESDLDKEHITMIKLTESVSSKKRLTPSNLTHPLFSSKQIYGITMDQVILSGVNLF